MVLQSIDEGAPESISYGFGAHIVAVDLFVAKNRVPRNLVGQLLLRSISIVGFGKASTPHYAVSVEYDKDIAFNRPVNVIQDCVIANGFNVGIRTEAVKDMVLTGNVIVDGWGGGILVDKDSMNITVFKNLVVGTKQLPSVLRSSFPWVRPVGGITVYSPQCTVVGNVVAGSVDSGFMVATGLLSKRVGAGVCATTASVAKTLSPGDMQGVTSFMNNEAVGCKTGLFIVNMARTESLPSDCAVVRDFKAWRNGHVGVLAVDAMANILVYDTVLAENHIGVSLNFFKSTGDDVFSGIYKSTVIGSLKVGSSCNDLDDSSWSQSCQAFTNEDPLGLSTTCGTLTSEKYKRVGVMLPLYTDAGKTCTSMGRFAVCDPPHTPDRLCAVPWEKRYGNVMPIQYAEQHIKDVKFFGFRTSSCNSYQSAAIAINPSGVDHQATLVVQGVTFDSDDRSKLGMQSSLLSPRSCVNPVCNGLVSLIANDIDGSLLGSGGGGQLLYNNPEYVAPSPRCKTVSQIGLGFFYCDTLAAIPFRQYAAQWFDTGAVLIGPLVTARTFPGIGGYSFAGYGPIEEMCSIHMTFSNYEFMVAAGMTQKLTTTGTVPVSVGSWQIRWDAPSTSDSAVVQIFIAPTSVRKAVLFHILTIHGHP